MAYRYNRINWQNKPNVATPISAENLNKMDKGIDDNDKAIGDLVQLNTLNKSSLVSAVNELNNNLGGLRLKYEAITVAVPASVQSGYEHQAQVTINHSLGVKPRGVLITSQTNIGLGMTYSVYSITDTTITIYFTRGSSFNQHNEILSLLYIY